MDHCARYLAFLGTKVFSESCQTARMECCGRIIINSSLFQIFRRFFLRKVWLLIIVPENKKLPAPSRDFGLAACDITMTSLEPRKFVFLLWAQSKVMETIVNENFSWGTTKTTFSIKIHNSVTSRNSEWGLVTSSDLENTLCGLRSRPRHEYVIVFQVNLQKPFF